VSSKRLRLVVAGAFVLAAAAMAAGGALMRAPSGSSSAPQYGGEELSPVMAKKLALAAKFTPAGSLSHVEGDRGSEVDDGWIQHSTPGLDIPSAGLDAARSDWQKAKGRGAQGGGAWKPLGPVDPLGQANPYRDRSVYNAGTPDFSGRIAHAAIDPNCGRQGNGNGSGNCRLWIANANGGVWMTDDVLAEHPNWQYVSESFAHNNTASIGLDPNDSKSDTLWVGTGEPNACGSGCEAGVGLYKSTNGGRNWTGPYGSDVFNNRAVGSIVVEPGESNTIFAASGRAIRGLSNSCCGGADALIPGAPHFGLYRSKDGGSTWKLVNQGAATLCTDVPPDAYSLGALPCSPRGARRVKFDPVDTNTIYASFFARGIWRSNDGGDTWAQIMTPLGGGNNERAEFDVVKLPNGNTRMYVGVGGGAGQFAKFRRNDDVRNTPAATVQGTWIDLTNAVPDTPGYSSFGYCDPQCSYDNYVYVPPGASADTVYLSGDNEYDENNFGPGPPGRSNGRAVLLSTDAGATFTDMTDDASDQLYPNELHPDHHALVTNPNNWKQFIDVGDGGIQRSNGNFVNDSGDCVDPKHYVGAQLAFCQMVLSRIPEKLTALNLGLRTLHFYDLNYNPHDPDMISGGTQDNGTWETTGSHTTWVNTNIADGGQTNFDIADRNFSQTSWQSGQLMVSYEVQNQVDQNWIADTLFVFYVGEAVPFIAPVINDPAQAGWLFTSRQHVFRSTNYGRNPVMTKAQHRKHCNVWYGDGDVDENGVYEPPKDICDDWKPLGDPGPGGQLTAAGYGTRAGGTVSYVARTRSDTSTLWASTSTGRVFVAKNADAADPATVLFRRIDDKAANSPPRYPTAIVIDPENSNHAWITYSGFNAKTPTTPGHVFDVLFDPATGGATFTALDGTGDLSLGDIPATSLAVSARHVIYVGTDYGVLASTRAGQWRPAGTNLPAVAVADLVLVPERGLLYAATHGQGAWELRVDSAGNG